MQDGYRRQSTGSCGIPEHFFKVRVIWDNLKSLKKQSLMATRALKFGIVGKWG